MAHLPSNHFYTTIKHSKNKLYHNIHSTTNEHIISSNVTFKNQTKRLKKSKRHVYCCSSATSSSSANNQQENLDLVDQNVNGTYENNNKNLQFSQLVIYANWQVRRMVETGDEMRRVAEVQAEAFHEPVFLFNDMFFEFFKAEVLSGLVYRLRNSPRDRYACLVAEPNSDVDESQKELVGVVDVTVQREDSVLQHLPYPFAEEYLYVSGIAVLNKFRRQRVATTLLKACDVLSAIWGFEFLVLRAYEDDYGARELYSAAGYKVVSADPPWMTSWIGRRRRVLMVKRSRQQ